MTLSPPDLDPLFAPDSVAVVGASPDSTYSSGLIDNLLEYGYEGDLHLVNPGRDVAWGRPCHDDLADVPGEIDCVVVNVPREYVVDVVRTAGELGVPTAIVISAGFAEADETGAQLEADLAAVADEYGIRVCGPNCIGVVDAAASTVLTSACSRRPQPGGIGLVSQSGALAFTTFFERGADEDVRFAAVASTGNEADLTLADYIAYMTDRPDVAVICAYVEGVDDPERFMDAAERAVRQGTPVLVTKIGRSEVAETTTLSHTGSVTGDDDAWEGAFATTGVERVPDIPDLLWRANSHAAFDPPASPRVCVASTSGGLASLLADMIDDRGFELPALPTDTEDHLLAIEELLTFGEFHNPIDIRGYGAEVLPEIVEVLFDAEPYDAYVLAFGLSAVDDRAERIADDLLEIAEYAPSPVFVLWTGRKTPHEKTDGKLPYERVREQLPLFYDPGTCVDALSSLVDAEAARERLGAKPGREELRERATHSKSTLPDVPEQSVLSWSESVALLEAVGVEPVATRQATDATEAASHAADLGFPVVLKIDSRDIPHRSEAGAVRTNIDTLEAVERAYEEIVVNAREFAPDASIESVLVQRQVTDEGAEALVGVSEDETFGPVVTIGPGGTFVEAIGDTAVRIPPLSTADAESAIEATALGRLLKCSRKSPPPNREAFIDLLERIGQLAATAPIAELDLNPVVVHGDGVAVVDAFVRTRYHTDAD